MDEKYIRDRISSLRTKKGITEYKMSYDLGHSRSYINNISSGKSLPSLGEFLAICNYLGVTPTEFFDEQIDNPELFQEIMRGLRSLKESDVQLILELVNRLTR